MSGQARERKSCEEGLHLLTKLQRIVVLASPLAGMLGALCAVSGQDPVPPDSVVPIAPITVEIGRIRAGAVPLAETPFSSQIVASTELRPVGGSGLVQALSHLPGVTLTNQTGSASQAGIRVRGFALSPVVGVPQSVSVFIDGVRVNEADASQVHLSLIPEGAIERIEFVRGPVGVFGKNSLAGALNFVTRRAGDSGLLEVDVERGSFSSFGGAVRASAPLGAFDGLVVGSYRESDGWRQLDRSQELSLFAKLGWRGDRTDAWLSYTFEADSLEGPGPLPESWLAGGALPPDLLSSPDDRRQLRYTGGRGDAFKPRLHFLSGRAEHQLSDGWTLQASSFGRFVDFRQYNDNITEPDALGLTDIASLGSTIQVLHRRGERLMLSAGAEWVRNDVDIEIHELPNSAFPGVVAAATEHLQTDEDNLGVFGEVWWGLGSSVALYGSLRYDHVKLPIRDLLDPADSGENRFSEVSGGLGLSGQLGAGLGVFAGYGRGFRTPVILEVTCADPLDPCQLPFDLGPDPPLKPVRADSWQAGLRLARARVEASLVGYWSEVYDDIFNVVDLATPTRGFFTNLDRTRRVGLEVSVAASPLAVVPGLGVNGSFAWTRATFQSPAVLAAPFLEEDPGPGPGSAPAAPEVEPGDRFPMVPEFAATLGLRYGDGVTTIHVDGSWTDRQFLVGDEGNLEEFGKLASSTVIDIGVERRLNRTTVFLELSNVLDSDYSTFGIISENVRGPTQQVEPFLTPGAPRHLTLGVRFRLWGPEGY